MSAPVILLDGEDISAQVITADAQFTQQANGQPGTCRLRVRDADHQFAPRAGMTLTVDVDDVRVWGGWALRVSPGWFFPVDDVSDPEETERVWTLEGVDYNILFSKRFLINRANPTKMTPLYPAGTPDDLIVLDIVQRFLELEQDGISTGGVTRVGTPNPDAAGNVGNPGESWGSAMTLIAKPTQAVFYIDPLKILRYVDVETVTAPFALTDQPNGGGGGGGSVTDTFDRTVALGTDWGSGQLGTWAPVTPPNGVSVSGGFAEITATGGWQYTDRPDVSVDVFRLTAYLQWPAASGYIFAGLSMGTVIGISHDIESFLDNTGFVNLIDTDGGGNSGSVPAPEVGAWHQMIQELDQGAGEMRFKLWKDGDPDPGWQVVAASTVQISDLLQIGVYGYPDSDPFIFDSFEGSGDAGGGGGGGEMAGYREMEITLDGTKLVNDMMVWGAGPHSTPDIRFKRVEDENSILDHGRWQSGEFTTALFTTAGVTQRASSYVYGSPQSKRGGKDDSIQVSCVTYRPGLTAGQIVSFTSEVFGYTDNLPIRRLGIRFPTPTDVEFRAYLSYDIDAPWSDYEFWFPKINFHVPPFVPPDFDPPVFPPITDDCDCGITDTFDRADAAELGTASSGYAWTGSGGEIVNGVAEIPTGGGPFLGFSPTQTPVTLTVTVPYPSSLGGDDLLGVIRLYTPGGDFAQLAWEEVEDGGSPSGWALSSLSLSNGGSPVEIVDPGQIDAFPYDITFTVTPENGISAMVAGFSIEATSAAFDIDQVYFLGFRVE